MSEKFPQSGEVQKSPAQILRETRETLKKISVEINEEEKENDAEE